MEKYKDIEKSIIKKFRKDIWTKFIKAIKDYKLIEENDRLMVCISGGKDSFLLAKLIQELERHGKIHFEAKYVSMNPGYKEENKDLILSNAKLLNIPLEMFDTDIFAVTTKIAYENPCYLCARMRRGHLYNKAKELGCNKIVLGHHLDDVIETTLLSMFYGAEVKTMMPKLHSDNFEGSELIRPMYYINESSIISWKDYNDLKFLNCACSFTERKIIDPNNAGKRMEIKKLINELRKNNKEIDHNILKALDNINLNCVLGTKLDGNYKSFLEDYK